MMGRSIWVVLVVSGALSGCVVVPREPPPPPLLVAYPGQGKTEAAFRADDVVCQAEAAAGRVNALVAVRSGAAPMVAAAEDLATLPPGQVFLRCMAVRGNVVQPVLASAPVTVVYRSYPAYPVYAGFGDYYPWVYGGYGGFGYTRGYYGYAFRGGYGGYRGGGWRR